MNFDRASFLCELADMLDEPELTPETSLVNIETWDSLNIVMFITYVDKQYKLVLSPLEIGQCQTVSDLEALIVRRSRQAA